ncbi:MAG TPA: hypothetical protein VMT62_06045 [Syntrophorhabdaceae bacterium]|nr:hypothetical protein [Syntrophorhabdaceae bacterium]
MLREARKYPHYYVFPAYNRFGGAQRARFPHALVAGREAFKVARG